MWRAIDSDRSVEMACAYAIPAAGAVTRTAVRIAARLVRKIADAIRFPFGSPIGRHSRSVVFVTLGWAVYSRGNINVPRTEH